MPILELRSISTGLGYCFKTSVKLEFAIVYSSLAPHSMYTYGTIF
jgi:hypothetical protein